MAARPYWKGNIKLALVSIPVEIFAATKSGAEIAFNQIHEPTGKRIHYEKVVPGVGPVEEDDIVKGYEYAKGHYVLLAKEEIEAVRLETRKTLDLSQFVDVGEIDAMYYEKPYYVIPDGDLAMEAYIVLRDALRATNKVGLGQLAMRGREDIVSLKPCGRGMLMETLRYADELQASQNYFRDIKELQPEAELLDLAKTLIAKKTARFDADKFHDHYVDALRDLIERKRGSKKYNIETEDEGALAKSDSNIVDLMAALKKSLEKPPRGGSGKPARKRPVRKHG